MYQSYVRGTGSYLPEKELTNKDLEKIVETSDEWILSRTGISARHIAADHQVTSDLAKIAAERALDAAGITAQEIDFIFFATTTPDQIMPNSACMLQEKLGAAQCGALDVTAACSGFLYCHSIADQMIRTGAYKNILVVGAEVLSRFVDYEDRTTCILFGDGAGAAVISRTEDGFDSKVYGHKLASDGSLGSLLSLPAGGSALPARQNTIDEKLHFVKMNGREIFKAAVRTMAKCCAEVLDQSKMQASEIDWLVPHQANTRIVEAVVKQFDFPMDKVVIEIERMGNTSAATIPIAFDKAIRDGRVQRGQNIMFTAFGGGLTSGSLFIKY